MASSVVTGSPEGCTINATPFVFNHLHIADRRLSPESWRSSVMPAIMRYPEPPSSPPPSESENGHIDTRPGCRRAHHSKNRTTCLEHSNRARSVREMQSAG
jgi:hypothetical protein